MSKKIALMQGASAHATEAREANDYYATDPVALEKFLDAIDFPLNYFIWEPACGGGHLVNVLLQNGYRVLPTDLVEREGVAKTADFLKQRAEWSGDILTNPPFKDAEAFVRKALDLILWGNRVIFFLRIMFLESTKRQDLFKKYPPKYVYVHSSRVATAKGGDFEKYKGGGKSMCYAWFVWEKGYKGDTVVRWIK
jgi:hypothetical protein|tara:strand:- start:2444 stop:3028 length:585 start_codon:yes stop_codon:yes gene_type:complete